LNLLNLSGLHHGFLQWLASYLTGRSFRLKFGGHYGDTVSIPSGLPQGSVLAPYLFAAFMGSIDFERANVYCTKYADDVTLVEVVTAESSGNLLTMHEIRSQFEGAGLKLNAAKSKEMLIIKAHKRRSNCEQWLSSSSGNENFGDHAFMQIKMGCTCQ